MKNIDYIIKYNEKYCQDKLSVEQLKKENAELKQKLNKYSKSHHDEITPSAPELMVDNLEQVYCEEIPIAKVV